MIFEYARGAVVFTAPCPSCGEPCPWTSTRGPGSTDVTAPNACRCYVPGLARLRAVSDALAATRGARP